MDPQRPSTSTNLKTSASMSKLEKELNELLDLAENIKDESVFHQEHRYKKFKAKNDTIHDYEFLLWQDFLKGLRALNFHIESIYWCSKILDDVRLCDSSLRSLAMSFIATSSYDLGDYENVLKYGAKYLEFIKG